MFDPEHPCYRMETRGCIEGRLDLASQRCWKRCGRFGVAIPRWHSKTPWEPTLQVAAVKRRQVFVGKKMEMLHAPWHTGWGRNYNLTVELPPPSVIPWLTTERLGYMKRTQARISRLLNQVTTVPRNTPITSMFGAGS